MELIRPDVNIDFIGKRKLAFSFSLLLIIAGIISLVMHGGPRYGVDFSGGTLLQLKFKVPVTEKDIRNGLKDLGMKGITIQKLGGGDINEFLIRSELTETKLQTLSKKVKDAIEKKLGAGNVEVLRVEMVGPKVGKDLRQKALLAIYYSLLFIAIYISGRFEMKWGLSISLALALIAGVYVLTIMGLSMPILILGALIITLIFCWYLKLSYALAAVVALIHDVAITVGAFSITNKEVTLAGVAALLTIVGYSLNDTIIVFDRIRENLRKSRREKLDVLINKSVNQTLSRTLLTSGTTLIVVLCLFVMGGSVIHDFAFALLVGVVVGTYSSIYVASPILILYEDWVQRKRQKARASRR